MTHVIMLGVGAAAVVCFNTHESNMKLLKEKVFRIGLEQLWYCPDCDTYFVSLQNRTYSATHPIPSEKAQVWYKLLAGVGQLPKDVSSYGDAYMRANHVQDRVCPLDSNHEHDNYDDTNIGTEKI